MKVKLRIPAVSDHGTHDVGETVDFKDPNQALALLRAYQADPVGEVPFPGQHPEITRPGEPLKPSVEGHTPVPSLPAAVAATSPKPAPAPAPAPTAPKPAPAPAPAPTGPAKP